MKRNIHIVKKGSNWIGKEEKKDRPLLTEKTQQDAINEARRLLHNSKGGGELIIHREDGPIRQKDTVPPASDPFPPKG